MKSADSTISSGTSCVPQYSAFSHSYPLPQLPASTCKTQLFGPECFWPFVWAVFGFLFFVSLHLGPQWSLMNPHCTTLYESRQMEDLWTKCCTPQTSILSSATNQLVLHLATWSNYSRRQNSWGFAGVLKQRQGFFSGVILRIILLEGFFSVLPLLWRRRIHLGIEHIPTGLSSLVCWNITFHWTIQVRFYLFT